MLNLFSKYPLFVPPHYTHTHTHTHTHTWFSLLFILILLAKLNPLPGHRRGTHLRPVLSVVQGDMHRTITETQCNGFIS
jgi:hypothetical protein